MDPAQEPFTVREIWPPGTVIRGDYVIEKRLGAGGFGTVYLARHRFLETMNVIKRLHDQYASDADFARRFLNEGRAIRRLRTCPHIVEVEHMTQTDEGHLILVMEYVPGGDLAGLLKSGTVLSVEDTIEFGRQIALALQAAHQAQLIHRDIKPQNILVGKDAAGKTLLKLIDFGIAADHVGPSSTNVMRGGSIGYAAPEQWARAGKELDGRADLYALGVTMFRMLTGRMPYPGAYDFGNWLDQVRAGPPVKVAELRPDVPTGLSELVCRMLALRPEGRPDNAGAVIEELDRLVAKRSGKSPTREDSRITIRAGDGPNPLEVRVHLKDRLKYVWIPPGCFRMGASEDDPECQADEKPASEVRITKGFWLGQTNVTVEAYQRFVKLTGASMPEAPAYNPGWKDESLPMVMVSWNEAQGYCTWAGLRLPTEAEWEYAARAASTGPRYGLLDQIGWYDRNSSGKAHPVGLKQPNAFDLFDMLGNVWELTADRYKDSYYKERGGADDPMGPAEGDRRVLRGGSWSNPSNYARASGRFAYNPSGRIIFLGFRCAGENLGS